MKVYQIKLYYVDYVVWWTYLAAQSVRPCAWVLEPSGCRYPAEFLLFIDNGAGWALFQLTEG